MHAAYQFMHGEDGMHATAKSAGYLGALYIATYTYTSLCFNNTISSKALTSSEILLGSEIAKVSASAFLQPQPSIPQCFWFFRTPQCFCNFRSTVLQSLQSFMQCFCNFRTLNLHVSALMVGVLKMQKHALMGSQALK